VSGRLDPIKNRLKGDSPIFVDTKIGTVPTGAGVRQIQSARLERADQGQASGIGMDDLSFVVRVMKKIPPLRASTAEENAPFTAEEIPCPQHRPWREYSDLREFVDNLPYLGMAGLGALIFLTGWGATPWGYGAGGMYFLACLAGALWVMIFICPYCQFYGTRSCPCGYGRMAARLRPKSLENRFARQFRRHIPVIVPLWFIPPAAGAVFLVRNFSALMTALVASFAIDAFLILPLVARKYACAHCPQKNDCPWMKEGRMRNDE
jgi:hypothetical protein